MIPKIIHHIWIGNKPFPEKFYDYVNKWKMIYNDYNFIFWDNELVNSTKIVTKDIEKYYYSDLNIAIKSDLLRFKILEKIGGIYIDVDTEPLRKMPYDVLNYKFFSGYQPNNEIAIGIMGSEPNEDLTKNFVEYMTKNIENTKIEDNSAETICKISGPESFTFFLHPYINKSQYKFFETKYFYPYSWNEMEKSNDDFLKTSPDSYSVHHWAQTWK